MQRFGLSPDDILNGVRDKRFRALMSFEIEPTEALYRSNWPGIMLLSTDGQPAAPGQAYREPDPQAGTPSLAISPPGALWARGLNALAHLAALGTPPGITPGTL